MIRYIEMLVQEDKNIVEGIALIADDTTVINETIWAEEEEEEPSSGEWTESQMIPEGQYIIGLKVNIDDAKGIESIAFLTTELKWWEK